jgi:hypothetical protein
MLTAVWLGGARGSRPPADRLRSRYAQRRTLVARDPFTRRRTREQTPVVRRPVRRTAPGSGFAGTSAGGTPGGTCLMARSLLILDGPEREQLLDSAASRLRTLGPSSGFGRTGSPRVRTCGDFAQSRRAAKGRDSRLGGRHISHLVSPRDASRLDTGVLGGVD